MKYLGIAYSILALALLVGRPAFVNFLDGQDSDYAGYGAATIPKPASAGLLLLAGVGS